MAESPLVSIIITNYNGKKYLKKCFDSLLAGTYNNIEIVFVDNGSSDGSIDLIKVNFPQALIIDNKANLGLAMASNKGAQAAKGKYLFFYNNDTIADIFLVEKLVRRMEEDPTVGICGCRTYTYDGGNLVNEGVACDIFGYPCGKGKTFYVDAAIFIRRELFDRISGFDDKMFLYGEDRDICWRCWLYGYKVAVQKDAVFYHDTACITTNLQEYQTNILKRFWGEYNALRSILKNYSGFSLIFVLPLFIAINAAEVIVFLLKGEFALIEKAYLLSYVKNVRDLNDTLKERMIIQRERKISDLQLMRQMVKASGKLLLFLDAGIPVVCRQHGYGKS